MPPKRGARGGKKPAAKSEEEKEEAATASVPAGAGSRATRARGKQNNAESPKEEPQADKTQSEAVAETVVAQPSKEDDKIVDEEKKQVDVEIKKADVEQEVPKARPARASRVAKVAFEKAPEDDEEDEEPKPRGKARAARARTSVAKKEEAVEPAPTRVLRTRQSARSKSVAPVEEVEEKPAPKTPSKRGRQAAKPATEPPVGKPLPRRGRPRAGARQKSADEPEEDTAAETPEIPAEDATAEQMETDHEPTPAATVEHAKSEEDNSSTATRRTRGQPARHVSATVAVKEKPAPKTPAKSTRTRGTAKVEEPQVTEKPVPRRGRARVPAKDVVTEDASKPNDEVDKAEVALPEVKESVSEPTKVTEEPMETESTVKEEETPKVSSAEKASEVVPVEETGDKPKDTLVDSVEEKTAPVEPTQETKTEDKVAESENEQAEVTMESSPANEEKEETSALNTSADLTSAVETMDIENKVEEKDTITNGIQNRKRRADETEVPDKITEEGTERPKKKARRLLDLKDRVTSGFVMTMGNDEAGQLGLSQAGSDKRRPVLVKDVVEEASAIAAGALHTLIISGTGEKVYTFGCNDELALGRKTAVDKTDSSENNLNDETVIDTDVAEATPTSIEIPAVKLSKVVAGDSLSAALSTEGAVYIWGCLRDQNGRIGLDPKTIPEAVLHPFNPMPVEVTAKDIASGDSHLLILTTEGDLYSMGVGEQGQLGRLKFDECKFDKEKKETFLTPQKVKFDEESIKIERIWAGSHCSFAKSTDGKLYGWGLNNYSQLGFSTESQNDGLTVFESFPVNISAHWSSLPIEKIETSLHHTLALDQSGQVYSVGRHHYGRLGLGEITEDAKSPRLIEALSDELIVDIACGGTNSFAVSSSGKLYSWGMATVFLGHSTKDEDPIDIWEPKVVTSKNLTERKVYAVAAGSSHLVIIASGPEASNGAK
ncbi:Regulator of chromosome condensation [Halotydeus destructor]|nr:Regulator of chromosome condensation [Halotydeus destructor]